VGYGSYAGFADGTAARYPQVMSNQKKRRLDEPPFELMRLD
jgi:hypothetical protein